MIKITIYDMLSCFIAYALYVKYDPKIYNLQTFPLVEAVKIKVYKLVCATI